MTAELDFDEFYQAAYHRVVGQVCAMTGSLSDAEDSVQEAFARAWQNWNKVSSYGDAESWVRSVAFRISVSAWRKAVNRFSAHTRSHTGEEHTGEELAGLSPDRLAIVAALQRIPAEQRQVIVLHHLLDRSVQEIAREVGAPAGTVKARLARGRKALAPHLSEFAAAGESPMANARQAQQIQPRQPAKEGTTNV